MQKDQKDQKEQKEEKNGGDANDEELEAENEQLKEELIRMAQSMEEMAAKQMCLLPNTEEEAQKIKMLSE